MKAFIILVICLILTGCQTAQQQPAATETNRKLKPGQHEIDYKGRRIIVDGDTYNCLKDALAREQ